MVNQDECADANAQNSSASPRTPKAMPSLEELDPNDHDAVADYIMKDMQPLKRGVKPFLALGLVIFGFVHKIMYGSPIKAEIINFLLPPPDLETNDLLSGVTHVETIDTPFGSDIDFSGPESMVVTPDEEIMYVSTESGIVRFEKATQTWFRVAQSGLEGNRQNWEKRCVAGHEMYSYCGRPLGLALADANKLGIRSELPEGVDHEVLVAIDAYAGIYIIGNPRRDESTRYKLPPYWAQGDHHPYRFLNSVAISPDGEGIYFTESSHKFGYRKYLIFICSRRWL